MSSIVTAVFKASIGWLVNKGRDVAAEKLKEGDVTDEKIRKLIIREVEDIKKKLDGLLRKDLLAAVDSFETGIRFLYTEIDAQRHSGEPVSVTTAEVAVETVQNIEPADYAETSTSNYNFMQAKKRFGMARKKATDASNNEALDTLDLITAIRCRVMAAMLESAMETVAIAGNLPSLSVKEALRKALPECEQCLKKLHNLPAVQNSFRVELQKGPRNIKGRFGKDKRREIISTVCQVNRAIYDVTPTVGKDLRCVDTGEDNVDPLCDGRVTKVLSKVGMEHCYVPWSFGQNGNEEHKLRDPRGIAANSHGQFIIADNGDKTLKVFDSNGNCHDSFEIDQNDDANTNLEIRDIATDVENIYVLVELQNPRAEGYKAEVHVYAKNHLLHKFPVRRGVQALTVSGSKVLVLGKGDNNVVVVYEYNKRNDAKIKK